MPEGDTVYNYARMLRETLAGQVLTRSDLRVPALAAVDLAGWTVRESVSRGKHLLLRLESPAGTARTLHSHLRMDGSWRTYRAGARWTGGPGHTIRAVLATPEATAVGYHLHDLALVPTAGEDALVGHLGPDLLGPDWDATVAARRLAATPGAAIADALLDQRNLAGIGNMYKSELLFLRGVWPWRAVGETADLDGMVGLAHRLLMANRDRWTQATTGSLRHGEEFYVYGRAGHPCRRCGTRVERAEQGDHDRVTFWCPRCQPSG